MINVVTMLKCPVEGRDELLEVADIEEEIRGIVGGFYECMPMGRTDFWFIWLDNQKGKKFNRYVAKEGHILCQIKGDFLIAKTNDNGEYISITKDDYIFLKSKVTQIGVYL